MGFNWGGLLSGVTGGASSGSAFGPWGAGIGGVLGGLMGAGGDNLSDQASSYQQRMEALQAQDLAQRQKLYDEQRAMYSPIEQKLVAEASSERPLNYGQAAGQINRNFDSAGRQLASSMASRGMTGSGSEMATSRAMELSRASSLGDAFQKGLDARRQLGQSLLSRYNPLALQSNVSGALQNQASTAGQQANLYNQAAQQQWSNVGQGLGSLAQLGSSQGWFGGSEAPSYASTSYTGSNELSQIPTSSTPSGFGSLAPATASVSPNMRISSPSYTPLFSTSDINSSYSGTTGVR